MVKGNHTEQQPAVLMCFLSVSHTILKGNIISCVNKYPYSQKSNQFSQTKKSVSRHCELKNKINTILMLIEAVMSSYLICKQEGMS